MNPLLLGALFLFVGCQEPVHRLPQKEIDAHAQCEVHHVALKRGVVPIAYGLPGFVPGYWEAKRAAFPNSRETALGGCVVEKEKQAEVLYCEPCRAASHKWAAARLGRK